MNYFGNASFEFEIERYRNIATNELVIDNDISESKDLEFQYKIIVLNVEGKSYFQSGRKSGAPENCYPDEGDTEITFVLDFDGQDWSDRLTDTETDAILEKIQEEVCNQEPEYDEC